MQGIQRARIMKHNSGEDDEGGRDQTQGAPAPLEVPSPGSSALGPGGSAQVLLLTHLRASHTDGGRAKLSSWSGCWDHGEKCHQPTATLIPGGTERSSDSGPSGINALRVLTRDQGSPTSWWSSPSQRTLCCRKLCLLLIHQGFAEPGKLFQPLLLITA